MGEYGSLCCEVMRTGRVFDGEVAPMCSEVLARNLMSDVSHRGANIEFDAWRKVKALAFAPVYHSVDTQ